MLTNIRESFVSRMFTNTGTLKKVMFTPTGRTRIIDMNINRPGDFASCKNLHMEA